MISFTYLAPQCMIVCDPPEGSAAEISGQIMVNDQIIAVDGVPLSGFTNQEAVEILKKTGAVVQLSVVRFLRGLKFEELQVGIDQVWPLTHLFSCCFFLLAEQINDPSSGKLHSLLFLPPTHSSHFQTLERLFELTACFRLL